MHSEDIYYDSNYLKLFEKNNEGTYYCFKFEENGEIALYPFLINSVNNLGYKLDDVYFDIQGAYGYNGVLTNSMKPDFIEKFYQSFNKYCTQNKIIAEFTRFHPVLGNQEFSNKHLQIVYDRETVALDLTMDYESIWLNEYSSKNRNMIRKARKFGYTVEISEAPSVSEINTFIDIYTYSMKMADADEYYYFNKGFFYNTFSLLKKHTLLFNILDSDKNIVCSSIFFHYGDFFHYHLSGRSEQANNAVNNFLLDEAVKFAQRNGAKKFHFGGGRSSNPNDSLLKFKGSFSKTRLPFYIGKKIHNQQVYDEVVRQWEEKEPEKKVKYKNYLLKYRY